MQRTDRRQADELRAYTIHRHFQKYPAGSVLIEMGNTKVICAASIEERVPFFMKGSGEGWITAEYSLLPSATGSRTQREAVRGKQTGRTQEIERLIGRSLRAVVDMKALGERTIMIDCDVIQADGGTRTASITGAFMALVEACSTFYAKGKVFPVKDFLSAISVGISHESEPIMDLCYEEDSQAIVDMNVVMTDQGGIIEIQGTAEGVSFSMAELHHLLALASQGTQHIFALQQAALAV